MRCWRSRAKHGLPQAPLVMQAGLPFIALLVLSRQTQIAARASRLLGSAGLHSGLRGLSVLRRQAHGRAASKPRNRSNVMPYRATSVLRSALRTLLCFSIERQCKVAARRAVA